jgi:hypothetical protein
MKHLKKWTQTQQATLIITYADDNKFRDFFRRQGFSNEEDYPVLKTEWLSEKISHYKRATLAACRVVPHVDYFRVHEMLTV